MSSSSPTAYWIGAFPGVPSLPNKQLENVGWVFESSSSSPLLELESVSVFAGDTSHSSPTALKKISSASDSSSLVSHDKIVSATLLAFISVM